MKIILKGNPISNNSLYKRGRGSSFYMTKEAKALKESYQWQAKSRFKQKPLRDRMGIIVKLYFGNKRKHDYDNYGKLMNDSFNGIIWIDDSQIESAFIIKKYDPKNPRIEITI